jgi:hypothetical protein
VRPDLVVVSAPLLDDNSGLRPRAEPLHVEALVAERPVEALDGAVLLRLARIDERELSSRLW